MAYVNEDISDEDMVKYKVEQTSWPHFLTMGFRHWVIDREHDIYLRRAADDRGETTNEYWSFYWKGHEWPVYGYRVSYEPKSGDRMAQYTVRLKFTKFPEVLREKKDEIRADFMEAYRSHLLRQDIETTFIFE